MKRINITVFGAEEKCSSCIHLPSAFETKEWLEAAIQRKFPSVDIDFLYCDIEQPQTGEKKDFAERILNEEYFYPLVLLNGEVVAEGNPKLSYIYEKIEALQS